MSDSEQSQIRQHYERMAATALDWLLNDTDAQADPEAHAAFDSARKVLSDVPRPVTP